MKKIGITGGIGSGKTFVCHLLEAKGFPVFYTDQVAKTLMVSDEELVFSIQNLLGEKVYFSDGKLNKAFLAEKIFHDSTLREKINQLVHPAVYRAFDRWSETQTSTLVFIESALMIETGYAKSLDAVILVLADEKTRIKRILQRDKTTKEATLARIHAQATDEMRKEYATFLLENSENADLAQKLDKILQKLAQ